MREACANERVLFSACCLAGHAFLALNTYLDSCRLASPMLASFPCISVCVSVCVSIKAFLLCCMGSGGRENY